MTMASGRLELRRGAMQSHPDVLTRRRARRARGARRLRPGAPATSCGRASSAARRAGAARPPAHRVPRSRPAASPAPGSPCRTRATGSSTAARSRPICSGSGSRAPARPRGRAPPSRQGLRNVAYALLSGADGWMFDGEDALGQVSTMSLDNQRNLQAGDRRDPLFLQRRRGGRRRDERVGARASSAAPIVDDWREQLDFTTKIFRAARPAPRRSPRAPGRRHRLLGARSSTRRSTSSTTTQRLRDAGRVDRAVPAEDPDRRGGGAVERHARRARAAPRAAGRARSRPTCWSSSSRPASS